MSIFQKFHEFYKKNIFTDLEICVISTSNFQIQSVCNCHCLIIASLLPQTREILTSNSDESIQIMDIIKQLGDSKRLEFLDKSGKFSDGLLVDFNFS